MPTGPCLSPDPASPSRWRRGLGVQMRVVGALMIRDALSRYGHENLGFFWVVGEPLLFTSGIIVLWSFLHTAHGNDVGVVPFALTGYSFITMWRHIVGRSQGVIKISANFSYHRQIKLVDVVVAMAFLEVAACFTSFVVAFIPLWLFGLCPTPSDPLNLIGGYALTGLFSMGFGLLLAGLCQMSEIIHHIVPAFMYMTMPFTGIFTFMSWLPESARRVLQWSPLVNGCEMFRSGLFPRDIPTQWSAQYLAVSAALTLAIGLAAYSVAERTVEA